jgi:hypothetical protein
MITLDWTQNPDAGFDDPIGGRNNNTEMFDDGLIVTIATDSGLSYDIHADIDNDRYLVYFTDPYLDVEPESALTYDESFDTFPTAFTAVTALLTFAPALAQSDHDGSVSDLARVRTTAETLADALDNIDQATGSAYSRRIDLADAPTELLTAWASHPNPTVRAAATTILGTALAS